MGIIPYNGNGGVSYTPTNFIRHNPKPIQWFWNRFRINKWFKMVLLMIALVDNTGKAIQF
jgi:hypothetical protein